VRSAAAAGVLQSVLRYVLQGVAECVLQGVLQSVCCRVLQSVLKEVCLVGCGRRGSGVGAV